MSRSLYENHWGSPTLTLLNVLGVLGVLNVLCVLHVLHVLHVLNMLMDASLACWALFYDLLCILYTCIVFTVKDCPETVSLMYERCNS